jgi:protein-arginine deiminase
MLTFLASQNAQPLIMLEAGWLAVDHVDEMVQFLPSDNKIGFTIAVADTEVALDILQIAQDNGFGSVPVSSYDGDMTPDPEALFFHPELRNMSIDALLADQDFIESNCYAQSFMDKNLEILLDDIPLAETDILRVSVLWRDDAFPWPDTSDGLPRRVPLTLSGQRQVKS